MDRAMQRRDRALEMPNLILQLNLFYLIDLPLQFVCQESNVCFSSNVFKNVLQIHWPTCLSRIQFNMKILLNSLPKWSTVLNKL